MLSARVPKDLRKFKIKVAYLRNIDFHGRTELLYFDEKFGLNLRNYRNCCY